MSAILFDVGCSRRRGINFFLKVLIKAEFTKHYFVILSGAKYLDFKCH